MPTSNIIYIMWGVKWCVRTKGYVHKNEQVDRRNGKYMELKISDYKKYECKIK